MTAPLLVGDIGGTSVRFGLIQNGGTANQISAFRKFSGDAFASFADALAAYISEIGFSPYDAFFGIAGPIENGCVSLVNRPDWPVIDRLDLIARFGFEQIGMVNDFAAMARSVPDLTSEHVETLFQGDALAGAPILVAGAGTGFGVATLLPEAGDRWTCISGEGGHARFAAQTEIESRLVNHLLGEHDYISNELICGGKNLGHVHAGLCATEGQDYQLMPHEDILRRAEEGDMICQTLCSIRASGIMAAAGDLALINGTLGGVFLAGGVSQRLKHWLTEPEISERFFARGPRSDYIANIPIHLIHSEQAPLIGAAALYFEQKAKP